MCRRLVEVMRTSDSSRMVVILVSSYPTSLQTALEHLPSMQDPNYTGTVHSPSATDCDLFMLRLREHRSLPAQAQQLQIQTTELTSISPTVGSILSLCQHRRTPRIPTRSGYCVITHRLTSASRPRTRGREAEGLRLW